MTDWVSASGGKELPLISPPISRDQVEDTIQPFAPIWQQWDATLVDVLLSDRDIRKSIDAGDLGIEPFDPELIQPSSVDVRMDRYFRVFNNSKYTHIDPKLNQDELTSLVEVEDGDAFVLHPGEFVLASTLEKFTLPAHLAGRLEGKSSLGRLGLLTHSTAGFIDPGFSGYITLELSNVANLPITLWPGMKVGQLALFQMSSPAETPYGSGKLGSKYQGQRGPTPSKAYLNFPNG
ncbi:Deoxycytidine triphosphate deaminase [Corynebacterium deserti GIMN1.010]|uniref:dCTP deaminase, dUMP-forming n=1 Tax=Corynebacterium deserti GIMN1.010 TaxID=931089 RepID=A0A0M3QA92_9CORY|nr:Deoxycytidine triphosphate deaminase [Corynebacterium deserti GIMN1.010]